MLYFVTSYAPERRSRLKTLLPELIDAGLDRVQFSWGECSDKELYQTAEWVRKLTSDNDVEMIVNNRLDIALAVDADGLHIGQKDMPFEIAREILPNKAIIGVTVESVADLEKYRNQPVDYFGYGPIFQTTTKTDVTQTYGLAGLSEVRKHTERPIVAIGGITRHNVDDVRKAGADGVAVVGELYKVANQVAIIKALNSK